MKNYDELPAGTANVMGDVPHVITQIAKRSQGRGDFADWFKLGKTRGGHARKRETTGTIESQNIAAIKSEKVGKDVEYKYTNPAQLNFWREAWHNRAVANSKLREEVRQFGRLDEGTNRIPIEYEYYTPQRALKKAKLKDDDGNVLYFDPMEAAAFKRQAVLLSDPKELGAFLKTWDKTQNWWKLYALITRPAYYTRNLAGNYSNAYLLAGLTDPQRYGDAGALAGDLPLDTNRSSGYQTRQSSIQSDALERARIRKYEELEEEQRRQSEKVLLTIEEHQEKLLANEEANKQRDISNRQSGAQWGLTRTPYNIGVFLNNLLGNDSEYMRKQKMVDAPNMPGLLDIVSNPTPATEQYYSGKAGGRELSEMPLQSIGETRVDPADILTGLSPEQLKALWKKQLSQEGEDYSYEEYLNKWFPEQ